MLSCIRSIPQTGQWCRRQPIAKRHDIRIVIEDDTESETVAARRRQRPKASEVAGPDLGSRPILPPSLAFTGHRFGKPTKQNDMDEIVTDNRFALILRLPFEEALQKARCPPLNLGSRERQQEPPRPGVPETA